MRKILALIGVLTCGLVTSCATPVENWDRYLNFAYSLEPETLAPATTTIEQGEILLTWTAKAHATHMIPSTNEALIEMRNDKGVLFCGPSASAFVCYEDRDGNGAFDYLWNTKDRGKEPFITYAARTPVELPSQIAFAAIPEDEDRVLAENTLGVIYNGPVNALLNKDMKFDFALGEFQLGWMTNKDYQRRPNGDGWFGLRRFSLLYLADKQPKTTVSPLAFSFTILDMTLDGKLTLEYAAEKVDALRLTEKFDYDVNGEDMPETLEDVSADAASNASVSRPSLLP